MYYTIQGLCMAARCIDGSAVLFLKLHWDCAAGQRQIGRVEVGMRIKMTRSFVKPLDNMN